MASGKTHAKYTLGLLIVQPYALALGGASAHEILAAGLGAAAGLLMTPDLDLNHANYPQLKLLRSKRFPVRLFGRFWYMYWWPYAKIMPHRSALSHWPLLSTFLRLVYSLGIGLPLFIVYNTLVELSWEANAHYVTWFAIGLTASDTLHWIVDIISTKRKQRANRRKRLVRGRY